MKTESDDSNNEKLIFQALPVFEVKDGENINFDLPPITGEEYLYRVRLEASLATPVVVTNIDTKKFESKRTAQYILHEELKSNLTPAKEWQLEKIHEFDCLVKRSINEKNEFLKKKNYKKLDFPKKSSEWYKFCFDVPNRPLLSTLYQMNQVKIIKLLDLQIKWFIKHGYSRDSSEWIYSLMVFLEKPLLPESCSSLRFLSRKCNQIRCQITDSNDESLNTINLFIALIARYFGQTDLID